MERRLVCGFTAGHAPSIRRQRAKGRGFSQNRPCAMLRLLAQCLVRADDIMRRMTGVPISPTRDAATTGTRTTATDLSSPHGVLPHYDAETLSEPDVTVSCASDDLLRSQEKLHPIRITSIVRVGASDRGLF